MKAKLQLVSLDSAKLGYAMSKTLSDIEQLGIKRIGKVKVENAITSNKNLTLWGTDRKEVKIKSVILEGSREELRGLLRLSLPEGVYLRLLPKIRRD